VNATDEHRPGIPYVRHGLVLALRQQLHCFPSHTLSLYTTQLRRLRLRSNPSQYCL
jgi:hypothetical protein